MDAEILKKLQDTELGIMVDIDQFCAEHHIPYSLCFGTLIGAVRHKGFIPWDDDIDICMERKDYEKFLDLWETTGGIEGYYLQNSRNLDDTNINFSKVRKNGTAFITEKTTSICKHNGIWVDIFPLDRVPKKKMSLRMLKFVAKIRLIYTRNFPYTHSGKALNYLSKVLLLLPKGVKRMLQKWCEKYVTRYQNLEQDYDLMGLYTPPSLNRTYPGNIMEEFIKIPFEEEQFSIVKDYDTMLRIQYGDYMQLPPEEQRICGHFPKEVLF